jgi:hypothetical protein
VVTTTFICERLYAEYFPPYGENHCQNEVEVEFNFFISFNLLICAQNARKTNIIFVIKFLGT